MIRVEETNDYAIYDEVLDNEQFEKVWMAIQSDEFLIPHINNWSKVWRITDGSPVGTRDYNVGPDSFGNYMDLMKFIIMEAAKMHPQIILSCDELVLRSYLYPRGTKLNWHNDLGYSGAAIFYAHPEWASTWGGELMLARTPSGFSVSPPHLDHKNEDVFLSHFGAGTYITCKPNRLVLTRPGVWHSINRVDNDAGDHCRATVVGFFKQK
jgi:hypothetical protein